MSQGGNGITYSLIGTLTAAFILGGISLATGQSAMEERQKATEAVQKSNAAAVAQIPVIRNEIGHIKDDIADIDEKTDEILDAIKELAK